MVRTDNRISCPHSTFTFLLLIKVSHLINKISICIRLTKLKSCYTKNEKVLFLKFCAVGQRCKFCGSFCFFYIETKDQGVKSE